MMTAAELLISQEEYDALLWVREKLANNEFKQRAKYVDDVEVDGNNFFNMARAAIVYECQSTCCIGGWMSVHMQGANMRDGVYIFDPEEAEQYVDSVSSAPYTEKGLYALFFPIGLAGKRAWSSITNEEAVRAIDNYLETGYARWDEAAPRLVPSGLVYE